MSRINTGRRQLTVREIQKLRDERQPISMVTCYDSAFAKLVSKTDIEMVLVGDSLGNVMLGYDDTIPVTLEDMIHHCAAVSRSLQGPLLAVDMPFMTYQVSPEESLRNAGRLMKEGGAQAVKLEGGEEVVPQVEKIVRAGIPVVGHLGLTPQSMHQLGGYRVQGRGEAAERLMLDAKRLQDAGVFCLVLELVPAPLAKQVSDELKIPTIGIGAGAGCSGQVLVLQDLLGFDQSFRPRFLKNYVNMESIVTEALGTYHREVKEGVFPSEEQSYLE